MDFKDRFLQIDEKKRQAYLFGILSNDNNLRNDFLGIFSDEFVDEPPITNGSEDPVDMALRDIREIAEGLSSEFNDLLILDIYHEKPSRTAQREEFRNTGIISENDKVIFN